MWADNPDIQGLPGPSISPTPSAATNENFVELHITLARLLLSLVCVGRAAEEMRIPFLWTTRIH